MQMENIFKIYAQTIPISNLRPTNSRQYFEQKERMGQAGPDPLLPPPPVGPQMLRDRI